MTVVLPDHIESNLNRIAIQFDTTPSAFLEQLFGRFLAEEHQDPSQPFRYRRAGSATGKITIRDDFDDPLPEFEEYMS